MNLVHQVGDQTKDFRWTYCLHLCGRR